MPKYIERGGVGRVRSIKKAVRPKESLKNRVLELLTSTGRRNPQASWDPAQISSTVVLLCAVGYATMYYRLK